MAKKSNIDSIDEQATSGQPVVEANQDQAATNQPPLEATQEQASTEAASTEESTEGMDQDQAATDQPPLEAIQEQASTEAASTEESTYEVDEAHRLEILDLMDRFNTDRMYENHIGERFLTLNLAMLSAGQDKDKITTYHRKDIEPCAE